MADNTPIPEEAKRRILKAEADYCYGFSGFAPVVETRVVDPKTGGEKGQKQAQIGALDPQALLRVAEVAGFGAQKYARMNFVKGYAWSLSFDALMRHLLLFWNGEGLDDESNLPHIAHAAWHCLALLCFVERSLGTDDRISALSNVQRTSGDAEVH